MSRSSLNVLNWLDASIHARSALPVAVEISASGLRDAAPYLLEAAIQARSVLLTIISEGGDAVRLRVLNQRYDALSAAIAKARGEA